jgi:hypothetical protein
MAAYLTTPAELAALSVAPTELFTGLETRYPGWLLSQLTYWSSWIDGRLAKRYTTPFAAPYPVAVTGWLARIVTSAAYHKRGVDPTDAQVAEVVADAERARAEVTEAANGNTGLWDLPTPTGTSAISKGGPSGYTETDPYTWTDVQRNAYRGT